MGGGAQEPAERLLLVADHCGRTCATRKDRSQNPEVRKVRSSRTYPTADSRFTAPSILLSSAFLSSSCPGLMCKPVLVTLPFVLLLLDYWPLQRCRVSMLNCGTCNCSDHRSISSRPLGCLRLLWEKLPFFALAVASSVITLLAHHALGSLDSVSRLPWDLRIENALVSYVRYLGKTFWPSGLAVFYPYPPAWPMWEVVTCGLLLLAVCGLVLGTARRRPWLLVGWFWFLGVLVPFIGLVQAGAQAMADRFMYVPIIGLLCRDLGIARLAAGRRYQRSRCRWRVQRRSSSAWC